MARAKSMPSSLAAEGAVISERDGSETIVVVAITGLRPFGVRFPGRDGWTPL